MQDVTMDETKVDTMAALKAAVTDELGKSIEVVWKRLYREFKEISHFEEVIECNFPKYIAEKYLDGPRGLNRMSQALSYKLVGIQLVLEEKGLDRLRDDDWRTTISEGTDARLSAPFTPINSEVCQWFALDWHKGNDKNYYTKSRVYKDGYKICRKQTSNGGPITWCIYHKDIIRSSGKLSELKDVVGEHEYFKVLGLGQETYDSMNEHNRLQRRE